VPIFSTSAKKIVSEKKTKKEFDTQEHKNTMAAVTNEQPIIIDLTGDSDNDSDSEWDLDYPQCPSDCDCGNQYDLWQNDEPCEPSREEREFFDYLDTCIDVSTRVPDRYTSWLHSYYRSGLTGPLQDPNDPENIFFISRSGRGGLSIPSRVELRRVGLIE